ncbi:glutathione S-transferase PARB-like [Mercurialis annua]|uniref:glutathione S-transferase PARB-like n=1 Tax=Mercurialis annua TaxID=3986 RepID=UPI002160BEFF|nr:glutathione S-transferase PARB-like [Mercurialis annua]
MAAIKIHGSPISTATQRVLACLYEKEIEFEFINVNMSEGEHKKEPLISLNPFGQVPALEHGDIKLFESRAITQYLAEENTSKGTELLCPSVKAAVLVWKEVEAHKFEQPASTLNWEIIYKPLFGMTTDPAAVEANETKLAQVLDVYESRLAQSKYLACGCFTLVDLHHLPNLQLLLGTQCKKLIDARPHVSAWAADITARPAWAKVVALQKK